jgi:biotin carboxyl carrier protein
MERKLRVTVDGHVYEVTVEDLTESGGSLYPQPGSMVVAVPAVAPLAAPAPPLATAAAGAGDVVCTLGGVVESVPVQVGQQIAQGAVVVVIQAMKMNTPMLAPRAGRVLAVAVQPGQAVEPGIVLATIG